MPTMRIGPSAPKRFWNALEPKTSRPRAKRKAISPIRNVPSREPSRQTRPPCPPRNRERGKKFRRRRFQTCGRDLNRPRRNGDEKHEKQRTRDFYLKRTQWSFKIYYLQF